MPKTLKEMKFLLFPLIAIPIAAIFAFNSPAQRAHEAALVETATIQSVDTSIHGIAVYRGDTFTVVLQKTSSNACDNLMGKYDGWLEASIVAATDGQAYGPVKPACWHQYDQFQMTWSGAHYDRPVVAMCPLLNGIRRYEGCVNMDSDVFEWAN